MSSFFQWAAFWDMVDRAQRDKVDRRRRQFEQRPRYAAVVYDSATGTAGWTSGHLTADQAGQCALRGLGTPYTTTVLRVAQEGVIAVARGPRLIFETAIRPRPQWAAEEAQARCRDHYRSGDPDRQGVWLALILHVREGVLYEHWNSSVASGDRAAYRF